MSDQKEHSPLPWKVCGSGKCSCKMIWSEKSDSHIATGRAVACVHGEWGDDKDMIYGENLNVEGNAEFIVEACNNYESLKSKTAKMRELLTTGVKLMDRINGPLAECIIGDWKACDNHVWITEAKSALAESGEEE